MDSKIANNLKDLNNLNNERIFWLKISSFVVATFLFILFSWSHILTSKLLYIIFGLGIAISIFWWFWTMRLIRKIIGFKTIETQALAELVTNIKEIKNDIRKNLN